MPKIEKPGVASIPIIMGLLVLIISIGLFISSISLSDSLSASSLQNSNQALNFAQVGAKDALEKVVRNKNYTGSYTIDLVASGCSGSYLGCASVSVDASSSPKVIISEGRIGGIRRSVQVNLNLDAEGLFSSYTWQ